MARSRQRELVEAGWAEESADESGAVQTLRVVWNDAPQVVPVLDFMAYARGRARA